MTLQKSILLLTLGPLLGTLAFIGGIVFVNTRDSIQDLRAQIMNQTEEGVARELEAYFGRAAPALDFMQRSLFERPGEAMSDWKPTALRLAHFLETQPDLSFLYYGEAETGHLLGCSRDPENRIVINYTHSSNNRIPLTLEVLPGDELRAYAAAPAARAPYDARERPWFKTAVESADLVWTRPYSFLTGDLLGITAAVARRDAEGRVTGVFAADLVLTEIAAFLDGCQVGESGAAFILQQDGTFLVGEDYRKGKNVRKLHEALRSRNLDALDLRKRERVEMKFNHDGEGYLCFLQPIQVPGRGNFIAAVVVPDTEFMGVVTRNASITLLAAATVLSLAVLLSVFVSRKVTLPLAAISEEFDQIGNLRFGDDEETRSSGIHEIARFHDSVGKMKLSLRSFSRYVPRDLVRSMLADKNEAKLGGRLQQVTVQFSDLVGFTALSESMPPDQVFLELRDFLELLARCEKRHGGITSNFTGDGSMALFNAPAPLPGHAGKACRAALESIAELRVLNAERRAAGRPELRARLGINTAEVLLGNLGTNDRFTYTAVGDGVNIASRLENLNKLYGTEILVGEACREDAGDAFEWRRVDRVAVAGRRRGVTIYEPLGLAGEVDGEILEARDRYEEGLEAYFSADFSKAQAIFGDLRHQRDIAALTAVEFDRPGKTTPVINGTMSGLAAAILYDRVAELIETRVSEDWDGTYVSMFK